ncbi:MAG: hypothetical protein HYZ53_21375 [Planctomycetes bacterium]|nr:hypothetical protein [Planctomycetota bacterium]
MSQKKKIGVDLDGVLAETAESFLRIMQELHGRRIPIDALRGYDMEEWTGLTTAQVDHIFHETEIFDRAEPMRGAVDGLAALRRGGWEVHIVTYRGWKASLPGLTREWLARHGLAYDALEFTNTADKSRYARTHGLPVFVEDNWHSIEALAQACERVILVDWPYNQGPIPPNAVRARSWPEVVERVRERFEA